jgi:CRISPR-associated protein Cas2
MMRWWVVSYDIADPNRLRRVAKVMEGYGERVLYSVFECHLSATQLAELRERICGVINEEEDGVRWYPLCAWCRGRAYWQGRSGPVEDPPYRIV